MTTFCSRFVAVLLVLIAVPAFAQNYPDMEGEWIGNIRVVSSGVSTAGLVASGGAVISEAELIFTVDYQDGETFIGKSRTANMPRSAPSISIWGSIRSNGEEAIFITDTGGNGIIWFESPTSFEYCYTAMSDDTASAFCAKLTKKQS